MTTYIIIMVICLIFSAYFSATETAFSCANKTRLRAMAEKGNKRAEAALNLAEKYDRLISTILIGNNIVNILLASLGTIVFTFFLSYVLLVVSIWYHFLAGSISAFSRNFCSVIP